MSSAFDFWTILKHGAPEAGDTGAEDGGAPISGTGASTFPLSPIEQKARTHALLCTIGFLILLPVGTLVARYTRTFTRRWFWAHAVIQLLISGPVIIVGWVMGHQTATTLELPHFKDPHQRMGLILLMMYLSQVGMGLFIHFIKLPFLNFLSIRGRPLQNYVHALLGLIIFAIAASQVHLGLATEWQFALGGLHAVPNSAMQAWLALVIVFWCLYFLGLALVPRQFRQEKKAREGPKGSHMLLAEQANGGGEPQTGQA